MMFRNILLLAFAIILSSSLVASAEANLNSPHGFEFGSTKKEVVKQIESSNKQITENEKDSKDIRRIVFDGSVVELPISTSNDYETRLEFFKKKLMSSSVYYKFDEEADLLNAVEKYLDHNKVLYGDADISEKMLSYELWEWDMPDTKILLNSNMKSKSLMIEYIHHPVRNEKIAKELDDKRKGPRGDPAKEMFLDGTYSKPKY